MTPGVGKSGFIIEQTLATLAATGKRVQPFFFRTSNGHELDLVLDRPAPDVIDGSDACGRLR